MPVDVASLDWECRRCGVVLTDLIRLSAFQVGVRVSSSVQAGLLAYSRARVRQFAKLVNPNAARLTRLMRLLAASVAALVGA